MNDDPNHILDGCLDEVLGGRTPPELTGRILQAWADQGNSRAKRNGNGSSLPFLSPAALNSAALNSAPQAEDEPAAPPVQRETFADSPANGASAPALSGTVRIRARNGRRSAHRKVSVWPMWATVASVIGLGFALGGYTLWRANQAEPAIAQNGATKNAVKQGAVAAHSKAPRSKFTERKLERKPERSSVAKSDSRFSIPGNAPTAAPATANDRQAIASSDSARSSATPGSLARGSAARVPASERPYADPSPDSEILSFVNATLQQSWIENSVRPSPQAADSEWCRRVYLRVLGRIPTVDEVTRFTQDDRFTKDQRADKRAALVDTLLTKPEYVEQYAQHWATVWANLLIGRTTGRERDSLVSRPGLEQYLHEALVANKPYDQLVQELLTATGSGKPGTADYNGAANFLLAGMNKDATLATSRTARIFLGQQLQCAQCHQHPTGNWSQHQFWALNSFFRQMAIEKRQDAARLVNVDFADAQGDVAEPMVFYQLPSGLLKSATPEFIDGTKIPASGLVREVDRRGELARLVVGSDDLSRSLVNRYWSHFFGYGFTQPVDDMGVANSPSHPELLERLAKEFAAHGYDLKSAIRWIVLSDAFSRSSKLAPDNLVDAPEAGSVPLFTHYYSRQLPAEEVYNSLLAAAEIRKNADAKGLAQARVDWLGQFSRSMKTDDAEEESQFDGSMRQSIIMMNGDLMRRAVSSQHEGLLRKVVESNLPVEKKIEHLFLASLSREPSKRELDAARKIVASNQGNKAAAMEDILWALLNSNEFILDH
jgi:hypothetical protein